MAGRGGRGARPGHVLGAVAATAILLGGCADAGPAPAQPAAGATTAAAASATPTPSAADPAAVGADELGQVPVLMYHQIIDDPGPDDRTPAQFRAELERLYAENYRPVTAADLVAGHIDIPAGTHPVVLTFDDSTVSQARMGADAEPRPDTALGMLEAFGREHPDFRPTATFYVNTVPPPFVDDRVLPWLAAHGYEIGAHTRSHATLRELTDAGVQREIGGNISDIESLVPGYRVRTLALTNGVSPANRELARRGVHDGVAYELAGVMGVDEIPARSPHSAAFNPFFVPRIGADDVEPALDALARNPGRRYTSDGDPGRIAFPADRGGELDPDLTDRARPY